MRRSDLTLDLVSQRLIRVVPLKGARAEFSAWLRTPTNKHKRPFQEETIRGYAETIRALHRWMTARGIDVRAEGRRLSDALRAVELVECALRGR